MFAGYRAATYITLKVNVCIGAVFRSLQFHSAAIRAALSVNMGLAACGSIAFSVRRMLALNVIAAFIAVVVIICAGAFFCNSADRLSANCTGLRMCAICYFPGVLSRTGNDLAAYGALGRRSAISACKLMSKLIAVGDAAICASYGMLAISLKPNVIALFAACNAAKSTLHRALAISLLPAVLELISVGLTANGAGLGCSAVGIHPCMSDSFALGKSTVCAGRGIFAVGFGVVVSLCLTIGLAAYRASLGIFAICRKPAVRSLFNSLCMAVAAIAYVKAYALIRAACGSFYLFGIAVCVHVALIVGYLADV